MYKGFKFKTSKNELECDLRFGGKEEYHRLEEIGKNEIIGKHESEISGSLKGFVSNGVIDASKLQEACFPQIKAHVFISHSHSDKSIALFLAGWLFENFKLISFIDSCVWEHMDKLLRDIDWKYSLNMSGNMLDYEKRNFSTSNVHMMLSTALTMMIDQTECLLFLNTPNSITPSSVIEQTTSPWIYHELATSRLLRKNFPKRSTGRRIGQRLSLKQKTFSSSGIFPVFNYTVKTDHLIEIHAEDFLKWKSIQSCGGRTEWRRVKEIIPPRNRKPKTGILCYKSKKEALDVLYEDVIKKIGQFIRG